MILAKDGKSPFLPDELLDDDKKDKDKSKDKHKGEDKDKDEANDEKSDKDSKPTTKDSKKELPKVQIDLEGIVARVVEFPVDADNYQNLTAGDGKVFWSFAGADLERARSGEERHARACLV
jgi:hypothetical protein